MDTDECWQKTGKAPIRVRWLDINKGDETNKEYRSRLVAQEIKRDNREDLFAATPPLEAKKLLFSWAVTEGVGYERGEEKNGMKIDFIDIRKAFFHADARREVYVELPNQDASPGMCGKLKKSLYGTRDAAQNWMDAYIKALEDMGFKRGISSPCAFWHKRREIRTVVHGDDFTALGHEEQLDWFRKEMQKKFECKFRGRIGPADDDEKEMRTLNRIVTWTTSGIQYEGDQRHVEIAMKELSLN